MTSDVMRMFDALVNPPTDLPGFSHVNDVWWYDAPIPPPEHECEPWTVSVFDDIERCACGALRFRHGPGSGLWGEKNSRKVRP